MSNLNSFYPKKPLYNGTIGETLWVISGNNLSSVLNTNFIRTGLVYLQSDYPELYNVIGRGSGVQWTARTSGTTSTIYALTYANGIFVYGANGGALATSTDAITWTARTSGTTNAIYALTYANGIFVYGGSGGALATSTDGITWTARTSGTTSAIYSIAYGNGIFVYGGGDGNLIRAAVATSTDGITWTNRSAAVPVTSDILSFAYGNGIFVGGTANGNVAISSDGITWIARNIATTNARLLYNDGLFIGFCGRIVTSTDGNVWYTTFSTNLAVTYTFGNYTYVAAYSNGQVSASPDGINWVNGSSGTATAIWAVAYGNGIFVYGGSSGIMATTTDPYNAVTSTLYNVNTEFLVPSITTNSTITTTGLISGTGNLVCYVRAK